MTPQIFDTSVLIPWVRGIAYGEMVDRSLQLDRFLLCTVVWMELYAGTQDRTDKRQLDQTVRRLSITNQVVTPHPRDFYQAGQMIRYYSQTYGRIEPKDHICDVLIALCAVNADAELVTVNAAHFETWKRILARSGKNLSLSVVL